MKAKDVALGFGAGLVLALMNELGLERVKEVLHRSIVIAVALAANRRPEAGGVRRFAVIRGAYWADSSGRRNTLELEVAMSIRKQRSARSRRAPLPSPGRSASGRTE